MPKSIYIESPHQFYYKSDKEVTAKSLAESLMGLEGIVKNSMSSLGKHCGFTISEIDVLIDSISINSYKDNIIVRLLFGDDSEREANIEKIRKTLKLKNMNTKLVIGTVVAAGLAYGAYLHFKDDPATSPNIHIEFNNSFNSIGSDVNLTGDEMKEVIESSLTPAKLESLKKDTLKVLKPEGKNVNGSVEIDKNNKLNLPASIVAELPTKYEKIKADDPFEAISNTDVIIRATDLDNHTSGWFAVVPSIAPDKRVKLTLSMNVKPETLPSGTMFKADIVVIYKVTKTGKTPKEYQLTKKY